MKTLGLDANLPTGFAATERGAARRESGAAFAGLLDGERQRLDARAEERSAFDAPKPAANTEAAQAERRQLEARRAQSQQADRREPREPEAPAAQASRTQAKPGSEPTPQRAGLPAAKRAETARTETPSHDQAAAGEPESEAAAPASNEATQAAASTTDATPPRTAPDSLPADAAQRWSSTLALQARPEVDRAGSAGDADAPMLASATLAHAGRAGAEARTAFEPAAANASTAPPQAFEAELAQASGEAVGAAAATAEAPTAPSARIDAAPMNFGPTAAAPSASAPPSVAAPAQASLPAPMESPVFGAQLGFQLASFVQDGVQRAELQLNPAEMGPVAVHIVLEGNQAQIDFAAAQQRTREVLEAHWPALAAALHGAGFTLGGGGVSEQGAREREAASDGRGGRGARGTAGVDAVEAPAIRAAVSGKRGLLDLYA